MLRKLFVSCALNVFVWQGWMKFASVKIKDKVRNYARIRNHEVLRFRDFGLVSWEVIHLCYLTAEQVLTVKLQEVNKKQTWQIMIINGYIHEVKQLLGEEVFGEVRVNIHNVLIDFSVLLLKLKQILLLLKRRREATLRQSIKSCNLLINLLFQGILMLYQFIIGLIHCKIDDISITNKLLFFLFEVLLWMLIML